MYFGWYSNGWCRSATVKFKHSWFKEMVNSNFLAYCFKVLQCLFQGYN